MTMRGLRSCAQRYKIATSFPIQRSRYCHTTAPSSYLIGQTRHLTTADECPDLDADTLRLYSMKWCPFAQRTRLAFAHKRIRHEEVNVNLSDKPSWLLEKNPEGAVPLLELKSSSTVERVIGSLECCHWLEKSFTETDTLFTEEANSMISSGFKHFQDAGMVMNSYVRDKVDSEQLELSLLSIENSIKPSDFLTGAKVTMADFLAWPMIERTLAKGYVIDSVSMPKLSHWVENMSKLPAVINVRNTDEGYHRYWTSQREGATQYDFTL